MTMPMVSEMSTSATQIMLSGGGGWTLELVDGHWRAVSVMEGG